MLHEVVRYRGAVSDTNRADNHYRIVGGDRLQWSGRMRAWQADPRWVAPRADRRHQAQFSRSRQGRDRASVARHARPRRSIACRRSARSNAACGWRAASAATGSTPRRWAANWSRAASSRPTRPGGCLRPTNWSGPAACSAARWRKASIGAARPIERIEQGLSRYRERMRTRKAARLAARNGHAAAPDLPAPAERRSAGAGVARRAAGLNGIAFFRPAGLC